MKKNIKMLIIALAVAAVLAVAIVIAVNIPKSGTDGAQADATASSSESSGASTETLYAVNLNKSLVKKISVANQPDAPDFSASVIQNDGSQTVAIDNNTTGETYDTYYLNELLNVSTALEARQIVDEHPTDYAQYGITDDSVKFTVSIEGRDDLVITLGSMTPLKDSYYVRTSDSDTVYTIWSYDGDTFLRTLYSMRTLSLYPSFGTGYYEVQTVMVTTPDGDVTRLEKIDYDELGTVALLTSSYKLVEPFTEYADDEKSGTLFISPAIGLSVTSVVTDTIPDDLSQYGLDKPYVLYTANTSGETSTIYIGSEVDGDSTKRYVMKDGKQSIYIASGDYSFLTLDPLDILSTIIWVHNIDDVTDIKLTTPDNEYVFTVNDVFNEETPKDSVFEATMNGKPVEEMNMRYFFQKLTLFPTSGKLTEPVTGDPMYAFEFKYRDGTTHTLNLYKLNDMQLAAEVDGLARFYTSMTHMRTILSNIDTIEAGGTIQET